MYSMFDLLFDNPEYSPVYVSLIVQWRSYKGHKTKKNLMELLIKRKGFEKLIKLNLNTFMKEKKY